MDKWISKPFILPSCSLLMVAACRSAATSLSAGSAVDMLNVRTFLSNLSKQSSSSSGKLCAPPTTPSSTYSCDPNSQKLIIHSLERCRLSGYFTKLAYEWVQGMNNKSTFHSFRNKQTSWSVMGDSACNQIIWLGIELRSSKHEADLLRVGSRGKQRPEAAGVGFIMSGAITGKDEAIC